MKHNKGKYNNIQYLPGARGSSENEAYLQRHPEKTKGIDSYLKGSLNYLPGGIRADSDAQAFANECIAKGITDEKDIKKEGKKKGFTLIELLVVIAIIGTLASFLIPAVAKARESGKRGRCINNLSQIGLAIQTYALDYEGYMPLKTGSENTAIYELGVKGNPWGLGQLVVNGYSTLDLFKPANGKEVDSTKPVTETQWNLTPGPGKTVYTHYLYRRLDEGASAILANNEGKALVIDLNCNANPAYESHSEKFSHFLFWDRSVEAFDNINGALTVDDGSNTAFYDPVWQNADAKY